MMKVYSPLLVFQPFIVPMRSFERENTQKSMVSRTSLCRRFRCSLFIRYMLCYEEVKWIRVQLFQDVSNIFFRTECHATTIKYLRKIKQIPDDEKDVKVDLILFNSQLGDNFSCEDKLAVAKETDVQADIKKGKELREKRLIYIKSVLLLSNPEIMRIIVQSLLGNTSIFALRVWKY